MLLWLSFFSTAAQTAPCAQVSAAGIHYGHGTHKRVMNSGNWVVRPAGRYRRLIRPLRTMEFGCASPHRGPPHDALRFVLKMPVQGPSEVGLAVVIALAYVNTTSTTQRLFTYISNRFNALNVVGSR